VLDAAERLDLSRLNEPAPAFRPINRRTAIVHDWFQGFHGAERVVEVMRSGLFGDASPDIYTFHAVRELLPAGLAASIVKESTLASFPGIRQRGHAPGRWRNLLPVMPRYFCGLDLQEYDLVISSSHAFAANVRARPGALHVCYCYTPLRYAWLPEIEHARATGASALSLRVLRKRLQKIDRAASARPHAYVAISNAVRDRIRRFYERDAAVIYPPVDIEEFDPTQEKDAERFLWVHRLVGYKHPELVIEAFRGLPYRLTMVGIGPLETRVRKDLPANVDLRGWLSREELARLLARSAGFIHVGDEDFGMTMVEALASGTPVIALNRGGARDIVRDGIDGLLIDRPDPATIRSAVRALSQSRWDPAPLADRARCFSRARFLLQFRAYLEALGEGRGVEL